jgi:hypothetical protein
MADDLVVTVTRPSAHFRASSGRSSHGPEVCSLTPEASSLSPQKGRKASLNDGMLAPEQAHEGGELHQSLAPRHFRKCSTNDSGAPPHFRKHLHHKALPHFIHLTRLFWG